MLPAEGVGAQAQVESDDAEVNLHHAQHGHHSHHHGHVDESLLSHEERRRLKAERKEKRRQKRERKEQRRLERLAESKLNGENGANNYFSSDNETLTSPTINGVSSPTLPALEGVQGSLSSMPQDTPQDMLPHCQARRLLKRHANVVDISDDSVLRAYKDPFNVHRVSDARGPVQVSLYEGSLPSLLDLAEMSLEDLHHVKALRFAILKDGDWETLGQQVASVQRSSDATRTTVVFLDRTSLTIDVNLQPPRQVLYETSDNAYQVDTDEVFETDTALGAEACIACPADSQMIGSSCICDGGFAMSWSTFSCEIESDDGQSLVNASDLEASAASTFLNSPSDACIGSIISEKNGGTVIDSPDLNSVDSDMFPAGEVIRCATEWDYLRVGDPTLKFTEGASFRDHRPYDTGAWINKMKSTEDFYWCAPQPRTEYNRAAEAYRLYWGICVPCPTDAPTVAPTEHPTEAPTESPTNHPTDAPTNAPSASPTSSPTMSPTEQASSTLSPTSSPTEDLGGGNDGNFTSGTPSGNSTTNYPTIAPSMSPTEVHTSNPTMSPTRAPSAGPTEAPTSPNCVQAACQGQALTYAAASDFCSRIMGMQMCTAAALTHKLSSANKLIFSEDESLRAAGLVGDFSCFADDLGVLLWTADTHSSCESDENIVLYLDGTAQCASTSSGAVHHIMCCDPPLTETESAARLSNARKQVSSAISASYSASSSSSSSSSAENQRLRRSSTVQG
ncbi:Hypothetical Protein FCC1311_030272 [Hondaea fermentalgiana]|uniref:Uncharacterized protein n=1 Tax=Hondaea fermentalgiana TaxID=2315210 RepID=A0A2R5G8D4_9STRA|nr:Hypothetical Protein FCC1311_030272 [Hondaea fermentalgiana]|eukprot:GBG26805.1 Hypothetical Protein FCC1311_030272 [Hondaea fermentalgiana]